MSRALATLFLALAMLVAFPLASAIADHPEPAAGLRFHPEIGQMLVDREGRTLYNFGNDMPGVSTCTGGCATAWPALALDHAPSGAAEGGPLGVITRDDGSLQATWNGWPLYRFVRDTQPGETNGHGLFAVGGTWSAVVISGAS